MTEKHAVLSTAPDESPICHAERTRFFGHESFRRPQAKVDIAEGGRERELRDTAVLKVSLPPNVASPGI